MRRNPWAILACLSLVYFMVYFQRQAPAVLAVDLRRDLGLTDAQLGFMASAFFYPYALMQPVTGFFLSRFGPSRSLRGFFLLACLGSLGFGLCHGFLESTAMRFAVGLGVGAVAVPSVEILARWFPDARTGLAISLFVAVGGLGGLAGAGPLAYLDAMMGWRNSFVLIGLLSLALLALAWVVVRDSPKIENRTRGASAPFAQAARTVLASRGFWMGSSWSFFSVGVFVGFGGLWAGPYLIHVYGMSKVEAGHILSMLALSMVVGGPVLTWLGDKVLGSAKPVLVAAAAGSMALLAAIMAFPASMPPAVLPCWFFGLGLCTLAPLPLALMHVRRSTPRSVAGVATGFYNFFPTLGGGVVQSVIGLAITTHVQGDALTGEFRNAFLICLVCVACSLLSALTMKRRDPGDAATS